MKRVAYAVIQQLWRGRLNTLMPKHVIMGPGYFNSARRREVNLQIIMCTCDADDLALVIQMCVEMVAVQLHPAALAVDWLIDPRLGIYRPSITYSGLKYARRQTTYQQKHQRYRSETQRVTTHDRMLSQSLPAAAAYESGGIDSEARKW